MMGRGQNEWFWELYVIYMCFQWVPQHEASSFLPLWPSIVARRAWPASTFGEKWRSWTGSRRQPPTSAALNGEITVPIFFSKKDWKIHVLKERTFQLIGHATWSFAHLHIYIYINILKLHETKTISCNRCRETSHRYGSFHILRTMQRPIFTSERDWLKGSTLQRVEGRKLPKKTWTNHVLSSCWGDFWGEHFVRNFGRTAFTDHSHGVKDS